jgi:Family of unknown function (DUF5302)
VDIGVIENLKSNHYWAPSEIGEVMSEEKKEVANSANDPKARFREALERKKQGSGIRKNNTTSGPKISGGQSGGNVPKMFRRKSGSA